MWILGKAVDRYLRRHEFNRSKFCRFLYWLDVSFKWNLPRGGCGTLYELIPDSSGWWVRCPLFVIGHYHKSPAQNTDSLISGWRIDWWPNWPLVLGKDMYKYHWDNLKTVMTRAEIVALHHV